MKNKEVYTIILVLFSFILIGGSFYLMLSGKLEIAFTPNNNKFNSIGEYNRNNKSISAVSYQQHKGGRSARKNSNDFMREIISDLPSLNFETVHRGDNKTYRSGISNNVSNSYVSYNLQKKPKKSSPSGIAGFYGNYIGLGRRGSNGSEDSYASSNLSSPFSNESPRSLAPGVGGGAGGGGTTILIDPMTDPIEENRVPVGDGLGIMLMLAAEYAGKKRFL